MPGPRSLEYQLDNLLPQFYNEAFLLKDENGVPVPNFKYKVTLENGEVAYGVTDEHGMTQRIYTGARSVIMKFSKDDRKI